MKFLFINGLREDWPASRVLAITLGQAGPRTRAAADRRLLEDVQRLTSSTAAATARPDDACRFASGGASAGSRIDRLVRRHRIRAAAARRFRPVTTDSDHGLPVAPNPLEQPLRRRNQVWLADPSHVPAGEGWLYRAAGLDLATRKVAVGPCGTISHRGRRGGLRASDPAPAPRSRAHPSLGWWIAVSMRRVPQAPDQSRLKAAMSRTGKCYDNAPMESFGRWATRDGARRDL
jgi:transposase InsO family protein